MYYSDLLHSVLKQFLRRLCLALRMNIKEARFQPMYPQRSTALMQRPLTKKICDLTLFFSMIQERKGHARQVRDAPVFSTKESLKKQTMSERAKPNSSTMYGSKRQSESASCRTIPFKGSYARTTLRQGSSSISSRRSVALIYPEPDRTSAGLLLRNVV